MLRFLPSSLVAVLVGLAPGAASGAWRAELVVLGEHGAHPGPVQARLGETVELAVALSGPAGSLDPGTLPGGASIRWLQVIPRLDHVDLDPPNPGNPSFSNNVLFGPDHGKWLGFDRLEYVTAPLVRDGAEVTSPTLVVREAEPPAAGTASPGAGSVWFAAEVTLADGTVVSTPAGGHTDSLGLSSDVMRVSFRTGDDYLGWLSTYFHVPNVFGSGGPSDTRHQTERYVGADCADVLVGALRASGRTHAVYTSISGLDHLAEATSPVLFMDTSGAVVDGEGQPFALRWGEEISPGDLLVIDYSDDPANQLPRSWDHIGALVEDRGESGPDGVLDGRDVLRHVTALGLGDRPLEEQAPMRLRIWRWKRPPEPAPSTP